MPDTKAAPASNLATFQVTREETRKASKHWKTPSGVLLILDDTHIAFATDWANLVLKNFVQMCAEQAAAAMKAAQAGVSNAAPAGTATVANPVEKKSSIILTD